MNYAQEYAAVFARVCKALPGDNQVPDLVRHQFAAIVDKVWAEKTGQVAKSLPGVPQVAGPNMVADRLQQNFVSDVGFVGTQVFSNVGHEQIGGQYAEWSRSALKDAKIREMGDGVAPDELDDAVSYKPFATRVFGGRRRIGHLTRANTRASLGIMEQAARFLVNRALDVIERQFVASVWRASTWATGNRVTPATKWDTQPDGDHIIKDLQQAVEKLTNVWPVTSDLALVMPLSVSHAISRNVYIRGQGAAELAISTIGRLREMTGISRVYIGTAGQTDASGYLGKNAGLFVAPQNVGLNDPSAAVRVYWTGIDGSADQGFATNMMPDPLNYRTNVDIVFTSAFLVQSPELGVFFTDAIN